MSAGCETLRRASVSDDPEEMAELKRHARGCEACASLIEEDGRLLAAAARWREEPSDPPAALEGRIADAVVEETLGARRPAGRLAPLARATNRPRLWRWAAVAAVLAGGITGTVQMMNSLSAPEGDLARAVRQADEAQRSYAEAIARLDRQAAAVLERAGDPSLSSRQAAILLTYRDRIAHLDTVIAEVKGFLQEHPGHLGGHTVLRAAYKEKSAVLREVLDLKLGDQS